MVRSRALHRIRACRPRSARAKGNRLGLDSERQNRRPNLDQVFLPGSRSGAARASKIAFRARAAARWSPRARLATPADHGPRDSPRAFEGEAPFTPEAPSPPV